MPKDSGRLALTFQWRASTGLLDRTTWFNPGSFPLDFGATFLMTFTSGSYPTERFFTSDSIFYTT